MAIKRCDVIIRNARILAQAEDWSATSGISDEYLLRVLNHAKLRLQRLITVTQATPYTKYSVVAANGTDAIPIPTDCFTQGSIYTVEYSADGSNTNYITLGTMYERGDNRSRAPLFCMVESSSIFFDAKVDSGTFRIWYEAALDNLDIRRGQVLNLGAPVGSLVPYIQLSNGFYGALSSSEELVNAGDIDFICIVDRYGNIVGRNVGVELYDPSLDRLTLTNATITDDFYSVVGPAIPVTQKFYVTIGLNTTTHPTGPDIFQDYYEEFLRWEIEKQRSSMSTNEDSEKLKTIAAEIVDLYDSLPDLQTLVPVMRRD